MRHVHFQHKDYSSKSYYDKFLRRKDEAICECGKETAFKNAGRGYLQFCSHECYTKSEKTRNRMSTISTGKKQSIQTIQKRVSNTDQSKKEEHRRSTCRKKYGVEHTSQIPGVAEKIGAGNRGKTCIRTSEHSAKIAESRRSRGTNTHSEDTKKKISNGIRNSKKFQERKGDGTFVNASRMSNSRTLCGRFKGIHFRSSYELAFLIEMHFSGEAVESAESVRFACKYRRENGVESSYFPDFFLPDKNLVIEIKNTKLCSLQNNILKFEAARTRYGSSFSVLTERELVNITDAVKTPEILQHLEILKNEHLCTKSRSSLGGKRLL